MTLETKLCLEYGWERHWKVSATEVMISEYETNLILRKQRLKI